MLTRIVLRAGIAGVFAASLGSAADAQDRSDDNAITQAEDAFGFSVGRESIGIYNAGQVRGFSPTAAGNVRIDGLYFDPIFGLQNMLVQSTSIKVGLSAQGYPFVAPSGIVDNRLRRPGKKTGASLIANVDSWGGRAIELDGSVPLSSTVGVAFGATAGRTVYPNGTDGFSHTESLILRWQPSDKVEVLPFWSMYNDYSDEAGTFYVPRGDFVPQVDRAHHDESPRWADNRFTGQNMGVLSSISLAANTIARFGVFRSSFKTKDFYSFLLFDISPDGEGERVLFSDPSVNNRSVSGEARITQSLAEGPRLHNLHLSVRDRDSHRSFGGSDVIDFGRGPVGGMVTAPKPVEDHFGVQTYLHTQQITYGVAYDGRWKDVGELSLGLSRADFTKNTDLPDGTSIEAKAKPWLYNGTLALLLSKSIDAYAGYSRGFEESGTPPPSAVNRNEPLSSIITEQKDIGVRAKLAEGVSLVGGLFDLSRPYFGFATGNIFEQIGTVRIKGAEFSLSGKVAKNFNILVGGVFFRPKVAADPDAVGEIGSKPTGLPTHIVNVNGNWAVPFLKGAQLDFGLVHRGRLAATTNNAVFLPARMNVNAGMRYGFDVAGHSASMRVQARNLLDARKVNYSGSGVYGARDSRQVTALFTVDY